MRTSELDSICADALLYYTIRSQAEGDMQMTFGFIPWRKKRGNFSKLVKKRARWNGISLFFSLVVTFLAAVSGSIAGYGFAPWYLFGLWLLLRKVNACFDYLVELLSDTSDRGRISKIAKMIDVYDMLGQGLLSVRAFRFQVNNLTTQGAKLPAALLTLLNREETRDEFLDNSPIRNPGWPFQEDGF